MAPHTAGQPHGRPLSRHPTQPWRDHREQREEGLEQEEDLPLPAWLLLMFACAGVVSIVVAGLTASHAKAIVAVVLSYGAVCAAAAYWASRTRAGRTKNQLLVHGNSFGPYIIIYAGPVAIAATHGVLVGLIAFYVVFLVLLWLFNRFLIRRDVDAVN